jgi:aldehyde dehydrogenase (NAD+)
MYSHDCFYINGHWVTPNSTQLLEILNPATSKPCAQIHCANKADVDQAFAAARAAFPAWAATRATDRRDLLLAVAEQMEARKADLIDATVQNLGIPKHQTAAVQIDGPIEAVRYYAERAQTVEQITGPIGDENALLMIREPVGVCALITPWNYPLLQMIGKVAPALAAGCTMVEKPAEQTPTCDFIMAEIFDQVGLPAGVFNLISGIGADIGPLMSAHPQADMVSFTGSSASGISVAQAAAPSVKRVCQELGGKSALIITENADLASAISFGVDNVMLNAGQTCDALTRILIPASRYDEAQALAKAAVEKHRVGDPLDNTSTIGPLVSHKQWERVQYYLTVGAQEGATLLTGGAGYPAGLEHGAYIKPTVFADVTATMRIAKEEIFGPVLCLMKYDSLEQAIDIANDSIYGLSSGVWAGDRAEAIAIARRLQAGQCFIQGGYFRVDAPFGGYKQSGNGREWGQAGLDEYLETKAIIG